MKKNNNNNNTSTKISSTTNSKFPNFKDQIDKIDLPQDEIPRFLGTFCSAEDVKEEDFVDFRCPIWPNNDPTLNVEWYHEGKPIVLGSRTDAYLEDGIAGLCIDPVYESDSGKYTCVLKNNFGRAEQSTTLVCKDKSKKVTTTPFRRSSVQPIHFDNIKSETKTKSESSPDKDIGNELVVFKCFDKKYTLNENDNLNISMEIDITNSSESLNIDWDVEWFQDGHPLLNSNRIKPIFEYGVIGLKIDDVGPRDSGHYVANIYDKSPDGPTDKTGPGKLLAQYETEIEVIAEEKISREPISAASLHKIRQLEAWSNPHAKYTSLYPERGDIIRELIRRRKSSK